MKKGINFLFFFSLFSGKLKKRLKKTLFLEKKRTLFFELSNLELTDQRECSSVEIDMMNGIIIPMKHQKLRWDWYLWGWWHAADPWISEAGCSQFVVSIIPLWINDDLWFDLKWHAADTWVSEAGCSQFLVYIIPSWIQWCPLIRTEIRFSLDGRGKRTEFHSCRINKAYSNPNKVFELINILILP